MNLLIRADSSSTIGLGHIMRDIVLASEYPQATITFACQNLEGNIIDQIPYPVHVLQSHDPKELIELIKTLQIKRLIIDHYGIDEAYEKQIKNATDVTLVVLDDTYVRHCCDILINPNLYADAKRYTSLVPSHAIIRCGREFMLIRDEFVHIKKTPKEIHYDLFICMGGADSAQLTLPILQTLDSNLDVCVITTTANAHLSKLLAFTLEHDTIEVHVNAPNVAQLIHQSRFAIITPSSIAHETIFMEIPFIAIQSAPNQAEFVAYMKREGMSVMENFEPEAFKTLLKTRHD